MSGLALRPLSAPVTSEDAALDAFCQRLLASNPFLDNRVNGPGPDAADVLSIHRAAFEQLTDLAAEALEARRGVGAVLWGEAGIGKSHLLARLARWADDGRRAVFVYLHNLQAAPEHLPRSLLRAVLSILTSGRRRRFLATPLFHLIHAAIREAVDHDLRFHVWGRLHARFLGWVQRQAPHEPPASARFDATVYDVLFRFFASACQAHAGQADSRGAELAVRWLAGEALDPGGARALGLPPARQRTEPVALEDNQQIKRVLVALGRLATCAKQPFILAFDQVDNLDTEQFSALGRFLEAVIDASPNLLVVTAGVRASLLRWQQEGVIQHSAWDRLAQIELTLQRLTPAEALALVRERLRAFLAPFTASASLQEQVRDDDLFPLGRTGQRRFLADKVDIRPRDAINWAREGWRAEQGALRQRGGADWLATWVRRQEAGAPDAELPPPPDPVHDAIDLKITEKMREHRAWRLREPGTLPPDADHLAGLLYALLVECRDAGQLHGVQDVERMPPPRRGARPTYDLAVLRRHGDAVERTGVLIVTTPSTGSVTAFLRRLVEGPMPLDRLVLVTDEDVGLPLGERGQEYLDALERGTTPRFRKLELTFEEYADLDSLQAVLGLARSGDLEIEIPPGEARAVREAEVVDSHHRRRRYLTSRLLHELLADDAG
jgi:hypothetical protein